MKCYHVFQLNDYTGLYVFAKSPQEAAAAYMKKYTYCTIRLIELKGDAIRAEAQ